LLYVTTDKTLMLVPFDQNSMKITGEPIALLQGMRLGVFGSADLAVSADGTLVYALGGSEFKQEMVWVTREGKAQSVDPDWQGFFGSPALSPDGKRLAVAMAPLNGTADIWIKQLDRGPTIKLSLEEKDSFTPAWTPDGRSVTFSSLASKTYNLSTKRADGSARGVQQTREKRNAFEADWSPDGKWLLFQTGTGSPGAGDILGIRPGIDTLPVPLVATQYTEVSPALSPDGRWLAYTANETGKYEVYVVPFPNTGAAKWAVSTRGGSEPQWAHRGRELFFRDGAGNLVATEVAATPNFATGRTTILFPATQFLSNQIATQYAVAADDRRFLMIRSVSATALDKLIMVENWFEELKAKSRK
jgi:Tol biopolymer transport system component